MFSKPDWLRQWLARLNWDVFTWQIYVGDALESAVDWIIDGLNNILDWGMTAYDWARAALDRIPQVAQDLTSQFLSEISRVWNWVSSLPSYLADWWTARFNQVKEWVQTLTDDLKSYTNSILKSVNSLENQWDDFRRSTLPGLIDLSWWSRFWGGAITNIDDWWQSRRQQLLDTMDALLQPTRDEVRQHSTWLDMVRTLFTDPEQFVLDLLSKIW